MEPETLTKARRACQLSYFSVQSVQGLTTPDSSNESGRTVVLSPSLLGNDSPLHVYISGKQVGSDILAENNKTNYTQPFVKGRL